MSTMTGTSRGILTTRDLSRMAALASGALAQIAFGPLGPALPGGRTVGDVSDSLDTVITPAGYAFSIWGLIFAGCLALAVYQVLPGQRTAEVHRRTGWWLAAAFWGNAAFELIYPQGGAAVVVAQVLIVGIVVVVAVAVARAQDAPVVGLQRILPGTVASLLLGWVTIATVVGAPSAAVQLGAPDSGTLARAAGVFTLIIAGAIVLDVTMRLDRAAAPFALAACWGLLGVRAAAETLPVELAALFAVVVVLVGIVAQVWRTRRPVEVLVG